jgi:probable HAF family extracellular repeat protein
MPWGFLRGLTTFSVAALGLASAAANGQADALTDLGVGTAYGINNSGEVVLANGIYSNGTVTAFPSGFTGTAINSSAGVAGVITDSFGGTSAASLINGTVTNIGFLLPDRESPGLEFGAALGINDSGQVVGWGLGQPMLVDFAFIYANGTATVLPQLPGVIPGPAQAFGINASGQVVGMTANAGTTQAVRDAFIYDSNTTTLTDLGPGSAYAINVSGQVVGSNAQGPFIYTNGTTTQIPLPATGVAINSAGDVVGGHYFYSGGIIDLNTLISATDPLKPFVTLANAVGVNDHLLIAVNGVDSRTLLTHAYLVQAPSITISPGPLTFPSQSIGTVSSPQVATISNSGATSLPIDSISTSGDFLQTNNCGSLLTASGSCTAMVTFGPTAGAIRTGSLTVTTGGVPVVVPLTGTAPITATISSSVASVMVGAPFKLTWTASPGTTCTATGGSSADGWTGTIAVSGTQSVTETAGGNYEFGISCVDGSQSAAAQVKVAVLWPVVTATLSASPTTINSGQATTLTWGSTNASSCAATGGGTSDGWAGTKATNGSIAITEPFVPATVLTLNFVIKCKSNASGQSAQASVKVVESVAAAASAPPKSGGGGALDYLSLFFLFVIAALRRFHGRSWPALLTA